MQKGYKFILFMMLSNFLFAEINVEVYKNMSFDPLSTRGNKNIAVGVGILEVQAEDEDIGKKIKFDFFKDMEISNGKNTILIKRLSVEERYQSFIVQKKITHVKFYGIIDKKELSKNNDIPDIIEGKYIGETPIIYSIFSKSSLENSGGDVPTILPVFPDLDEGSYNKKNHLQNLKRM
ncbi:MAG: hypothetical protein ACRDCE_10550 [Cetobacterium sp.]|uniref:hypothetical protein n=1 Tax=Cetobacterium sp. TaxID=2071632 RepID=UPI003EE6F3B9